jgi:hypothetical protein
MPSRPGIELRRIEIEVLASSNTTVTAVLDVAQYVGGTPLCGSNSAFELTLKNPGRADTANQPAVLTFESHRSGVRVCRVVWKSLRASFAAPTEGWKMAAEGLVAAVQDTHRQIKSLLDEVTDGTDREGAFERLAKLAAAHEAAEQQVVHPLTARAQGGEGVATERVHEERKGAEVLEKLKTLGAADPEFPALFSTFREAVLEHASNEERDEHPILERVLSPGDSQSAAEAFRQAQSVSD